MNIDSPIDISVNTNRVFMQGLSGVLELSLRNRSDEESFDIELVLASRVFANPQRVRTTMRPESTRQRTIDLDLTGAQGVAGDVRFEAMVYVDAGESGSHRFAGEFVLTVLAHAESRGEINVNINKVIEQRGEKAGWGAINEVDLSNLVKLPETINANSLLSTERTPRFVSIPLEYEGPVDRGAPTHGVETCLLRCQRTGHRLLVFTQPMLTLGRSRDDADLVTWHLPRSAANDELTRRISSVHCALTAGADGIFLRHRSRSNLTLLDDVQIDSSVPVPTDRPSVVCLPGGLSFNLTPMPVYPGVSEDVPPEVAPERAGLWAHCARSGVGGWLIERRDDLAVRESYLWLLSTIDATGRSPALTAAPFICSVGTSPRPPHSGSRSGMAGLILGGTIKSGEMRWVVESPAQCLD